VLEYILVLVVSVSLVLALMMQVFQPLQKFLTAYMGAYTECLLETGELPSLGGDNKTAAEEGCSAKFETASWQAGRPPKPESSANNGANSKSGSEGAGGGGAYVAGGGGPGGGGRFFRSPRGTQSGDGAVAASKTSEIPVDGGSGSGFFKSSNVDRYNSRTPKTMSLSVAAMSAAEQKKLAKKEKTSSRIIATDGPGVPLKKTSVKPPEPKTEPPPPDTPFTIGNFMRMLLIIAIILAIVVFVGGQVLQMSKSYEK
jgi:hypothetical protein